MVAIGTLIAADEPYDRHTQLLDRLAAALRQLHLTVYSYRAVALIQDVDERHAALVDLHHRLRAMTAELTDAIEGRPPTLEKPQ